MYIILILTYLVLAFTAFTNEYRFPTSTTHNVTSSTSNANLNTWKIQLVLLFPVGVYIFLVSVWWVTEIVFLVILELLKEII